MGLGEAATEIAELAGGEVASGVVGLIGRHARSILNKRRSEKFNRLCESVFADEAFGDRAQTQELVDEILSVEANARHLETAFHEVVEAVDPAVEDSIAKLVALHVAEGRPFSRTRRRAGQLLRDMQLRDLIVVDELVKLLQRGPLGLVKIYSKPSMSTLVIRYAAQPTGDGPVLEPHDIRSADQRTFELLRDHGFVADGPTARGEISYEIRVPGATSLLDVGRYLVLPAPVSA